MIIYIAGPITGLFEYRRQFIKAEKRLQKMGHIVINPCYLPGTGLNNYMPICMAMIDQADAVYFLKGFSCSIGAIEEYEYTLRLNLKMYFECPEEIKNA